jgi:hypothetical protein
VKWGLLLQRITSGKLQDNGHHEQMHRTLKAETTKPRAADRKSRQGRFDSGPNEFNFEQPLKALCNKLATYDERTK